MIVTRNNPSQPVTLQPITIITCNGNAVLHNVTLRRNKQQLASCVVVSGLKAKSKSMTQIASWRMRQAIKDKMQRLGMFVLWGVLLNI